MSLSIPSLIESSEIICSWPRVKIPTSCQGVDIIIGIDEAGRGPVLGSLIYCAAFWPASEAEAINKLSFDDSKQLKEGERDRLFEQIKNHPSIGWVIEELTPEQISLDMLRPQPVSLNAISYNAVIKALERVRDTSPIAPIIVDVYVDTVGDPDYYKSRLVGALGSDFARFTIEKKADATYKVVSAASIIAKVTRDTMLKSWKDDSLGLINDFGSGYPGDENCVKWLQKSQNPIFGYPSIVRFSWSTTREILEKQNACDIKWECDDEDQNNTPKITSHFSLASSKTKKVKRSSYFTRRKMILIQKEL